MRASETIDSIVRSTPLQFDLSLAYMHKEPGKAFFNDGREHELLDFIRNHPRLNIMRNCPENIIAAIDEYGRTKKYLMTIGYHKGASITRIIAARRPESMVELGGYVGYSTILFGDAVRRAGGKAYLSIEENAGFAAISAELVRLAGLEDVVRVIVGPSHLTLQMLYETHDLRRMDVLFLDHLKPLYTRDLQVCETLGLVRSDTILIADNVIKPGNPEYLAYVRAGQRNEVGDAGKCQPAHKPRTPLYESFLVQSFQMSGMQDGIEITRCMGHH